MEPHYRSPDQIFPDAAPMVYGTFWERFGASLLDALIIGIPFGIVGYAMGDFEDVEGIGFRMYYDASPSSIIEIVVTWLYSALMESGPGQATLGKKALGLKVTGMNGERISFSKATGRHFAKILSGLILLIGYLMMLWDDNKQTLHDKLAGTLVVKR